MKTNQRMFQNTFLMLVLFITVNASAQGQLNLSFESWTVTPFGPTPTGWFGTNLTQETSGAQNGSSYVRINNNSNGAGMLMIGAMDNFTGLNMGGVPLTQMPTAVKGFYKTSGMVNGDTVSMSCITRWKGTYTGIGNFTITANSSGWTSFNMSFFVLSGAGIDSLFFIASGATPHGNNNSTGLKFDLDNISFTGVTITGMAEKWTGTPFMVYPNPASTELNIVTKNEKASYVIISDLTGKQMNRVKIGMETVLDLNDLEPGIFFYSITDQGGQVIHQNKFVVSR